jgi:hypothetical protein
MSAQARAAQFSPFAALTGYEDAVKETERLTEARPELDEERKAEIDRILQYLTEKSAAGQPDERGVEVLVTYFLPDEKKEGGALVSAEGIFRRIDSSRKEIVLSGKEQYRISLEDVTDLCIRRGSADVTADTFEPDEKNV